MVLLGHVLVNPRSFVNYITLLSHFCCVNPGLPVLMRVVHYFLHVLLLNFLKVLHIFGAFQVFIVYASAHGQGLIVYSLPLVLGHFGGVVYKDLWKKIDRVFLRLLGSLLVVHLLH